MIKLKIMIFSVTAKIVRAQTKRLSPETIAK